jgi:PAS domain S-box-containing protein
MMKIQKIFFIPAEILLYIVRFAFLPEESTGMRRFTLVLALLALSMGLMGLRVIPQNIKVRVGVYENTPKIYTATDGTVRGFWPDIINYMAKKEGWQVEWVRGTWQEGLDRLERNEIDILPDTGFTMERGAKYAFTNESFLSSWARVYTRDETGIQTILDLDTRRVGGLKGSLNLDGPEGIKDLAERFGVSCQFREYESYAAVFDAVRSGKIDAGITNKDFGDSNEKAYGLVRTPIILQPIEIRVALTKNGGLTEYLKEIIDADFRELKSDPDSIYYQAMDTYFGEKPFEVTPGWVKDLLWIAVGLIIILGTVSLMFRHEVNRQTERLHRSENRYLALLNNFPDVIIRMDQHGRFIDHHASAGSFIDRLLIDFRGKLAAECLQAEPADACLESVKKALLTHKLQVGEYQFPIQGVDRYFEARFTPNEDNEVIILVRDITDARQAEKALTESEERYHTLARVSPVGIFRTDTQGLTNYVNPTWCRISGLTAEEAMGNGWLKAVHPDDRAKLDENWKNYSANGLVSQADYRFIKPDGSITYVIGQAVPEVNADDQVVGYVGTITDITDRVNSMEALEASREAERSVRGIKETIQAANLVLTNSLDLKEVLNILLNFLHQIVPYDRARVILLEDDSTLRLIASRGFEPKVDRELEENILPAIKSNSLISPVVYKQSCVIVDDTAEYAHWDALAGRGHGRSWMGMPLVTHGQVLGYFSLDKNEPSFFSEEYWGLAASLAAQAAVAIQNARLHESLQHHADELEERVSERTTELARRVAEVEALNRSARQLNEDLKEAVKKAESADRLKSAFLATMSHELRTPLNSIIGFTGILLQKLVGPLSEEQEKQLKMVQGSARHLLELINDVLDISKIEADQILMLKDEFDLCESIRGSVDRVRPMADKKSLKLMTDLQPESLVISSDRRRVEQVLINLLNNAVKFTEAGSVTVQCRADGGRLKVTVRDTGIGIREEDIQTLFKPFRQIDTGITRQYEGTGLGLSICKRLIDLLGGTISVSSEPGKGSSFAFTLPVVKE